jgi:ribosomal protein L11 methyltransferase
VTVADYFCLRFTLTSESEERLVAELWTLGTLGLEAVPATESGKPQLLAYFSPPLSHEVQQRIDQMAEWPGARLDKVEAIPAADWLAEYRRQSRPLAIGRRFLVDPREPDERSTDPPSERVLLRIPARSAFGTGSHESTQLEVELLEGHSLEGSRVLDVGTGTGILGFVAQVLGATEVVGVDVDPAAALVALENCRLNRLAPRLVAGTVDCLRSTQEFDLALVNVLPERIRDFLESIVALLPPAGEMVVSGLLAEQRGAYLQELADLGMVEKRSRQSGEWVACWMEKAA